MKGPTQEVVDLINLVRERAFDPCGRSVSFCFFDNLMIGNYRFNLTFSM